MCIDTHTCNTYVFPYYIGFLEGINGKPDFEEGKQTLEGVTSTPYSTVAISNFIMY